MRDVTVLFEEVELIPGTIATWRADITYRNADNWVVNEIELPADPACRTWRALDRSHALWTPFMNATNDDRERVDAAAAEAGATPMRNPMRDVQHLSARQLGIGRAA